MIVPNRFIKESCRSSKNLDRLSDFEERLFWRLVTTADDYGRFLADAELVRSACFPYKSISIPNMEKALLGLQSHNLIFTYQVGDRKYGEFVTWTKHQGKPRSSKSKYPARLDTFLLADASNCMQPLANVPGGPDTDTDTDTDLNSSSLRIVSSKECEEFEKFWEAYPRKVGKKDARKAWDKAVDRPPITDILQVIGLQKVSEQWVRDGGQFIPHPSTWLNQGRWADVIAVQGATIQKCQERVPRGNFLKACGEPSVTVMRGRPLCQAHKEHHEQRASASLTTA